MQFGGQIPRCQQITESYPTKKLRADPIGNCVYNFRPVLGRVDVHSKWSLAKWSVDYLHDGISNRRGVGIRRHD